VVKLVLPLKAEYFDAIAAGTKLEEYRLANAYWEKRLLTGMFARSFDGIVLTKGYPRADDLSRRIELPWRGWTRKTIRHPHFGPDSVEVFAIDVASRTTLAQVAKDGGGDG
jgi:hypothetical protein